MSALIGTGIDLVQISAHSEYVTQPGSTFASVYTDREWSYCASVTSAPTVRPLPHFDAKSRAPSTRLGEADGHSSSISAAQGASLAGCWAAKEAAIKAWSCALYGEPPPIAADEFDWREVEVIHDRWRRPALQFHGAVAEHISQLAHSFGGHLRWHVTVSHDGDYAIASVHLSVLTFS
ncbi:MAG: holo-ACP synthase [Actinomycetaceae bacterium]|nr:holo-ACP synthase [Actinomycetaceae bacterium]